MWTLSQIKLWFLVFKSTEPWEGTPLLSLILSVNKYIIFHWLRWLFGQDQTYWVHQTHNFSCAICQIHKWKYRTEIADNHKIWRGKSYAYTHVGISSRAYVVVISVKHGLLDIECFHCWLSLSADSHSPKHIMHTNKVAPVRISKEVTTSGHVFEQEFYG